ncbi:hypothetical protein [Megasphaera hominis]|jgi:hypothetical protein|uniref:Uncharacterized protein n=1 Tax=Megasphaera hominis TaxID=159836 RepID=A0ABR6VH62_9FIRM|nr:hypothetical protein [Megasphaera hominis]MBC3536546.1 hypothetical protein [Megasphaera hominis]
MQQSALSQQQSLPVSQLPYSVHAQRYVIRIRTACAMIAEDLVQLKASLFSVFDAETRASVFFSITNIEDEVQNIKESLTTMTGLDSIDLVCSRIQSKLQSIRMELANSLDISEYKKARKELTDIASRIQYVEVCILRMI